MLDNLIDTLTTNLHTVLAFSPLAVPATALVLLMVVAVGLWRLAR